MKVLSLFDGMSCGRQALERAGLKVEKYYASEVDKYAIMVTMANYPDTIQLGDVRNVKIDEPIDLLIGGSPCQSFSFAGKRKGMSTKDSIDILSLEQYLELKEQGFEFEGQSYLFWEYVRILKEIKPKFFLLENVMMEQRWEDVISKTLGFRPIMINSALVSAQNRKRLYWTNIGTEPGGLFGDLVSIIEQPKDKGILLKDVLESEVDEKYFLSEKLILWLEKHSLKRGNEFKKKTGAEKSCCLTSSGLSKTNLSSDYIVHNMMPQSSKSGKGGTGHLSRNYGKTNAIEILGCDIRLDEGLRIREGGKTPTLSCKGSSTTTGSVLAKIDSKIRRLTPIECERLQTVKDNYTNHVSDSQRYKMLGNGWTIDVIAHIFSYLKI